MWSYFTFGSLILYIALQDYFWCRRASFEIHDPKRNGFLIFVGVWMPGSPWSHTSPLGHGFYDLRFGTTLGADVHFSKVEILKKSLILASVGVCMPGSLE